jgi:cell fate regulator YaaT (PSP1 superfamily)
MLAINVPKLSGQCGKLICCLKYEDDCYTEERKKYPDLGSRFFIDKVEYTVTSINILSSTVKIENEDDIKFLPLDEFIKQTHFKKRKDNKDSKNEQK